MSGTFHRVMELAVEPASDCDWEALSSILKQAAASDPSFSVTARDEASKHMIIAGLSEDHLDAIIARLRIGYGISPRVGAPQVSYRETVTTTCTVQGVYKRLAASGEFAKVVLRIEPMEPGSGFSFENRASKDAVPEKFVPEIESAVEEARAGGLLVGFPVIDFRAILVDGAFRAADSSGEWFKIATRKAFIKARVDGWPVLLEPMMSVQVRTPEEYTGTIIGDLRSRRGEILDLNVDGDRRIVRVFAPLSQMFGYANSLRALTDGRAAYTMEFDHYEPVPRFYDGGGPSSPAIALRA